MAIQADSVSFGISTKGHRTVLYRNFEYVKVRENKNSEIYWRCKMYQSYKCKAYLKTIEDRIVSNKDQEHTHEGNLSTSLARLAIAQMKEKMGEASATPAAVVGLVSRQLDDHVRQALPKRATLARSLQRHRKAALAENDDGAGFDANFVVPQQFADMILAMRNQAATNEDIVTNSITSNNIASSSFDLTAPPPSNLENILFVDVASQIEDFSPYTIPSTGNEIVKSETSTGDAVPEPNFFNIQIKEEPEHFEELNQEDIAGDIKIEEIDIKTECFSNEAGESIPIYDNEGMKIDVRKNHQDNIQQKTPTADVIISDPQAENQNEINQNENRLLPMPLPRTSFPNSVTSKTKQGTAPKRLKLTNAKKLKIKPVQDDKSDEFINFFNSLLPHINKLSDQKKMLLKIDMEQLVYKHVYGEV